MPANTTPIFVLTPNCSSVSLTSSNTARDGSGTMSTVFTAGTNGSRVDYIVFTSTQTIAVASVAKVCRVFVTDASGFNPKLRAEVALTAVTPTSAVIGSTSTITFTNGLVIRSGQLIRVTASVISTTDCVDVFAHGGDY